MLAGAVGTLKGTTVIDDVCGYVGCDGVSMGKIKEPLAPGKGVTGVRWGQYG